MKTHDVAKALLVLAKLLRDGPNVELDKETFLPGRVPNNPLKANAPAALATLAALARFNKAEWASLIDEYELGVPIKATDSVRDILGRLLSHINEHEEVRNRLAEQARKPRANVSPELMNALSILLKK